MSRELDRQNLADAEETIAALRDYMARKDRLLNWAFDAMKGDRERRRAERTWNKEMDEPRPTDAGRAKYPPDGYYHATPGEMIPCTCEPSCLGGCKGECGCKACHAAYQDFLSFE